LPCRPARCPRRGHQPTGQPDECPDAQRGNAKHGSLLVCDPTGHWPSIAGAMYPPDVARSSISFRLWLLSGFGEVKGA
jgi:hypothetical protein